MSILSIIFLAIVLVLIVSIVFYNRFVTLINRSKEAWADINVQLKRRYDLIPNLVNTVKGYAAHEAGTFEKITVARSQAMQAGSLADKSKAEDALSGALKSLFAVSENYPDLKANENFLELQRELADTENKIQAARRFYNGNVRDLNIALESFPSNIIARTFGFAAMELFQLSESDSAAKEPVKVDFAK